MKRLTATTVLCLLLFSAAFVTGKGPSAAPEYPDSLRSVWLYTEGVKQNAIAGDSVRARELFLEAIRNDSTYAPAYYELAANGSLQNCQPSLSSCSTVIPPSYEVKAAQKSAQISDVEVRLFIRKVLLKKA